MPEDGSRLGFRNRRAAFLSESLVYNHTERIMEDKAYPATCDLYVESFVERGLGSYEPVRVRRTESLIQYRGPIRETLVGPVTTPLPDAHFAIDLGT
jgi:hypothetical protein